MGPRPPRQRQPLFGGAHAPHDPEIRLCAQDRGDARPEEGVVGIRLIDAAPDRLEVHVQDEGPGIEPAEQKQIFEIFHRGDDGAKRAGSGIGLAFCKLAIQRLGGEIGVSPAEEGGTIFWFSIPREMPQTISVQTRR